MATGLAEQEKERRLLSVLGNNNFLQEVSYEDYPKYIEAINLLAGLKGKYRDYLSELKKIIANNPKKSKENNYEPNENDKKRCNDWLNDF